MLPHCLQCPFTGRAEVRIKVELYVQDVKTRAVDYHMVCSKDVCPLTDSTAGISLPVILAQHCNQPQVTKLPC